MTKEIQKVVIFYKDGTFTEINNVNRVQEFGDKPVETPWPTIPVVTTPCAKCGSTHSPCYRSDCPTGWGNPWNNKDTVID